MKRLFCISLRDSKTRKSRATFEVFADTTAEAFKKVNKISGYCDGEEGLKELVCSFVTENHSCPKCNPQFPEFNYDE